MSVLTEKQVEELANKILGYNGTVLFCIREWNEKQTATQFEPDWSKAPKSAIRASVGLTWVKENGFALGYTLGIYDRPKPVITPHPHAEIIAKYAEVAARRSDPWVEFEWTSEEASYVWRKHTCSPIFKDTNQYRHIGEDSSK